MRRRVTSQTETWSPKRTAVSVLMAGILLLFAGATDNEFYLRIHRSIDLFGKVYKEIALQHVDDIDPERLLRSGVDGMLKGLDPYTVFLDDGESDDIDLITTGRYGGIGVSIGLRDGEIVIVGLLEGYSAAKQGLQVGDRVTAIDGMPLKDLPLGEIRKLAHGPAGTEVRLTISREGERNPIEFVVLREEIPVRNISYAGFASPGIGYIRIERFSRTAADDLRNSLKELAGGGKIDGVILDLRDNPGGLLDIAVDVVAKFVPESSLVVSTRGRLRESERKYYSSERPMLPEVPLAVLVNDNTASASEIVAGAIQDLDRGVVVGTRTFGKGLVQTVTRLTESASLKITTARYYTPSGRCIQELDYTHRAGNGDATIIPDSLRRRFQTRAGRSVSEAGGIVPDTLVGVPNPGSFMENLYRRAMFFKFVSRLAAEGRLSDDFEVTERTLDEFEQFLSLTRFEYDEDASRLLKELREQATSNRYGNEFLKEVSNLAQSLQSEKTGALQRFAVEVMRALRDEVLARSKGEKARIASSLENDAQVSVAEDLLRNRKVYSNLLSAR